MRAWEVMPERHVVLVGAGIAGLTAAVGLQRRGVPILLLERAPSLRAAGGGLLRWSNAIAALRRLGLADAVLEAGTPVETTEFRTWDGEPMWRLPVGAMSRWCGEPSVVIARADVRRVLAGALEREGPRFGERCVAFARGPEGVSIELAGGARVDAAALLAADGIHSAVRAQLHGEEPFRSAYQEAWVGIADHRDPAFVVGRAVATAVAVVWRDEADAAVQVLAVVPGDEALDPVACVLHGGKRAA